MVKEVKVTEMVVVAVAAAVVVVIVVAVAVVARPVGVPDSGRRKEHERHTGPRHRTA